MGQPGRNDHPADFQRIDPQLLESFNEFRRRRFCEKRFFTRPRFVNGGAVFGDNVVKQGEVRATFPEIVQAPAGNQNRASARFPKTFDRREGSAGWPPVARDDAVVVGDKSQIAHGTFLISE